VISGSLVASVTPIGLIGLIGLIRHIRQIRPVMGGRISTSPLPR